MSFPTKVRDALIERQGGLCGGGCTRDLRALLEAKALHKYLPKGRKAVEVDHITPRSDAVLRQQGMETVPMVLSPAVPDGMVWIHVDHEDNLQALCGWCHHDKITDERPGYRKPVQSPLLGVLPGRGQAVTDDNRARRAAKAKRIGTSRAGGSPSRAPVKRYARG